jgi:ParB/RepB/Spo0J family partition protein
LQNLVARKLPTGQLELIAGGRRYKALLAKGVKPENMPIQVRENVSDQEAVMTAFTENNLRRDMTAIEEGRAFQTMTKLKIPIADIAGRYGYTDRYVKDRLALLDLPDKIQDKIEERKIGIGYAEALLLLKDAPESQYTLAHKIAQHDYEVKTVQDALDLAQRFLKRQKELNELVKKYGPCPKCGSKFLSHQEWEKDKITCGKCGHSWNKNTKVPWPVQELKDKAAAIGLTVEITNGKAKLSPTDIQEMVEAQKAKMKEAENEPKRTFRSRRILSEILQPLILNGNLVRIRVEGDKIEIALVEDCGLHFMARRHEYQTGEHCQVKVEHIWNEDDDGKAEHARRIHNYIDNLAKD